MFPPLSFMTIICLCTCLIQRSYKCLKYWTSSRRGNAHTEKGSQDEDSDQAVPMPWSSPQPSAAPRSPPQPRGKKPGTTNTCKHPDSGLSCTGTPALHHLINNRTTLRVHTSNFLRQTPATQYGRDCPQTATPTSNSHHKHFSWGFCVS